MAKFQAMVADETMVVIVYIKMPRGLGTVVYNLKGGMVLERRAIMHPNEYRQARLSWKVQGRKNKVQKQPFIEDDMFVRMPDSTHFIWMPESLFL